MFSFVECIVLNDIIFYCMVVYLYILYFLKCNVYIKYDYYINLCYNIKNFNIRDFICICIMMVMFYFGEFCNV